MKNPDSHSQAMFLRRITKCVKKYPKQVLHSSISSSFSIHLYYSNEINIPIRFHRSIFLILRTFNNGTVGASTFSTYKSTKFNTSALKCSEKDHMRKVLTKYPGCLLFQPKINARNFLSSTPAHTTTDTARKLFLKDKVVQKLSDMARIGFTSNPKVVSQMERQCSQEYKQWRIEKQLYVLELWHHVNGSMKTKCIWLLRDELLERFPDLPQDQALQLMYYLTRLIKPIPETQQTIIENRFLNDFGSMPFDAVSIWSLALFKNGAEIKNKDLLQKIFRRLLESNLKKFHEIELSSVLKVHTAISLDEIQE